MSSPVFPITVMSSGGTTRTSPRRNRAAPTPPARTATGHALIRASYETMSLFQALVLALLQGVTELFPVSSLGHTVILPRLLGWNINQADPTFLAFVVLLHVGTAIALAIYFWRDWLAIVRAVVRSVVDGRMHGTADERLGWRLIAGTVPAGLVGVVFQKQVQSLFANPRAAAPFLIINGGILFGGERGPRRAVALQEGRAPLECAPGPTPVR